MKQAIYILCILFALSLASCNNKNPQKNSTENENPNLVDEKDEQSKKTSTFSLIVDAMAQNDMKSYNANISKINNIDTLVLYSTSADEEEKYFSLIGLACKLNNLEIMNDLIKRGASIEIGSEDEIYTQDVLYYAILGGNAEMIKVLIDRGANVNSIYSATGITPLALCIRHTKHFMADVLLQHGAKVDGAGAVDLEYVFYPLHEAIAIKDIKMVEILLKYNPDLSIKNVDGVDPIQLAKKEKLKEIVRLLENYKSKQAI